MPGSCDFVMEKVVTETGEVVRYRFTADGSMDAGRFRRKLAVVSLLAASTVLAVTVGFVRLLVVR